MVDKRIAEITDRIIKRSAHLRNAYLERSHRAAEEGPNRASMGCSNFAHAVAACPQQDKDALAKDKTGHIGIVTAYNDMLSAHKPYESFPEFIRQTARAAGGSAQVAGGVPAMCDGVTQGRAGMELSLFSRDVIAMATGVALSHDVFDAALYLGVCDKIVPGLVIGAASFGHLPSVFVPAGPMPSGLPNSEKAAVRQKYAKGEVGRKELLAAEMQSYHSAGTCTFYGTANTNQMLMEFMGLQLPGASFVNPDTQLREALTRFAVERVLSISKQGNEFTPICDVLDECAFVNGAIGLLATGGSTNLTLHLLAMARAAGVILTWQDLSDLSKIVPLITRIYPNGLSDVNHYHQAGGLGCTIYNLLEAELLHEDVRTIMGPGMATYAKRPELSEQGSAVWRDVQHEGVDDKILRKVSEAFQASGGLSVLKGNLGEAVIKTSAVKPEHQIVEAGARVFQDQSEVKAAFDAGELAQDVVIVLRGQGPRANGMPELHSLTPILSVMQDRGFAVALVTDGRMSGASGKVPAAIHLTPEALEDGPISKVEDGDIVRLDAITGTLELKVERKTFDARKNVSVDLSAGEFGCGREMFAVFRKEVSPANCGASAIL
ncbi:MAG: phosphogluconate dehydratase [Pseudomonadota bacterium]